MLVLSLKPRVFLLDATSGGVGTENVPVDDVVDCIDGCCLLSVFVDVVVASLSPIDPFLLDVLFSILSFFFLSNRLTMESNCFRNIASDRF